MGARGGPAVALAVLFGVFLLLSGSVLPATVGGAPDPAAVRGWSVAAGAAAGPVGPVPASSPVPAGGRLFDTQTTAPDGVTNTVSAVVVDPATGVVFAANKFAGTVTEFAESTGALLSVRSVAEFAAGSFPASIAIDLTHHRLYVPISTIFGEGSAGGWLLVLDESTLNVLDNVSFPLAPLGAFEPTFLALDAPTAQLFVENATLGELAAVNLTSLSINAYLECPVVNCAMHGYGLLDDPADHVLVLPTSQPQLWLVNTSNDSTRQVVNGPARSIMGWSTVDTFDRTLWVENYSYIGPTGSFLRYNLPTFAPLGSFPTAPPRGSALSYDPLDNLLLATDVNGSQDLSVYNATTAGLVVEYHSADPTIHPFTALAFDPTTRVVVAAGSGNGSTIAFQLPALTPLRGYSSFPLAQVASGADPSQGLFFVLGSSPTTVRALNESDGSRAWESTLPGFTDPVALAVDEAAGALYALDGGSGTLISLNTSTGAIVGSFALGNRTGPCALALDGARNALYVGETFPPGLAQFDLATHRVVASLSLPGSFPCGLALAPGSSDLLALSVAAVGQVDAVQLPNLTAGPSWTVAPGSVGVAVDPLGIVSVLDGSGSHLSELNATTGDSVGSVSLGGFRASGIADDPVDHLLLLTGSASPTLEVVFVRGPTVAGNLTTSGSTAAPSFDARSGTFVAPLAAAGETFLASAVPVPSAPQDLTVTAGNESANASWSPPATTGPDPVDNYECTLTARSAVAWSATFNESGENVSVTNLSNGVAYAVTVAARSAAGLGTTPAFALVTPAGIPFPPVGLHVTASAPGTLLVNWSAPASDDGAPVTDYTVHVSPTAGGAPRTIDAGTGVSTPVGGLAAATNYTVFVTATNLVGSSHPSASATGVTPPTPPASLGPYWAGGLAIVGAALVAVGAYLVMRRRRRTSTTEVPPSMEGSTESEPDRREHE
ncbi:MAG TPA: fibronectin type III domain-containing protein [Thermoplasmata archaeon]|nr:fibronectin type III domain-containing protein [Thermoplasmata archaeon]